MLNALVGMGEIVITFYPNEIVTFPFFFFYSDKILKVEGQT